MIKFLSKFKCTFLHVLQQGKLGWGDKPSPFHDSIVSRLKLGRLFDSSRKKNILNFFGQTMAALGLTVNSYTGNGTGEETSII